MGTVISVLVTRYILQIQQQIKHMSFQTIMVSRVDFKGGGVHHRKSVAFPDRDRTRSFLHLETPRSWLLLGGESSAETDIFFL